MGRTDGLQVWLQRNLYRNLSTLFDNRRTKDQVLLQLVNLLYLELFGGRVQVLAICTCYYGSHYSTTKSLFKKAETTDDIIEKIKFMKDSVTLAIQYYL